MDRNERATGSPGRPPSEPPPGTGLEARVAGPLCYLLGFVTGLLFLLLEPDRRFVRFHAFQSIAFSVVWFGLSIAAGIITFVPFIGPLINALASLVLGAGGLVVWVYLMWQAYRGRETQLPWVGQWAREQADREPGRSY